MVAPKESVIASQVAGSRSRQRAAEAILATGAKAVLIKGGHRPAANPLTTPADSNDVLYYDGDAYLYAAQVMTENMMARDAAEGIDAFIEKRAPVWTGT